MFRNNQSEEELQEIKSLLINYLSNKAVAEADKAFVEKGYTPEVFESWENEHFRKSK
jgi:uncharacterized phosphosugar-binding protein